MSDNLRKYKSLYSSTSNTFSTGEGVTITPASVVGLPTDTEIVLTFDRVDSSGTKTPSKMERILGTIIGSNFVISSGGRGFEGTEQVHTSPVVEMIWNAADWNSMITWGLVEHTQAGVHTSTLVTSLKATGAEVNTGTNDAKIVTPKALADSDYAKTTDITVTADSTTTFTNKDLTSTTNSIYGNSLYQQAIINGGFTVNQRVYASGATLTSGSYGHDRWKAGTGGGDYSFTQLAQFTQITIASGKTLIQVIENKNVIGGTYTLSWTGTAQARYAVNSDTPTGAYSAIPIAITGQTAGTVMSIEFNTGTLSNVVLNSGSVALPFMPKSFEDEYQDCLRYFERIQPLVAYQMLTSGFCTATTNGAFCLFYTKKRVAPSFVFTAGNTFGINNGGDAITTVTAIDVNAGRIGYESANVHAATASGLTVGQGATLNCAGTAASCYINISAEL